MSVIMYKMVTSFIGVKATFNNTSVITYNMVTSIIGAGRHFQQYVSYNV